MFLPNHPVYVPSRGRPDRCLTADMFVRDQMPFHLVVEPSEEDAYRERYDRSATILVLPHDDFGLMHARNWIRDHAEESDATHHWQFDDNIRLMYRLHLGKRLPVRAGVSLRILEDFEHRYTNVGIAGFNYGMFITERDRLPPFVVNAHVYSATLVNHQMPYRWRRVYNDDTDICLQALSGGWATIQFNFISADKIRTMLIKGGNTDDLYGGDGRLRMARSLERDWPGVVTTRRRFGRPQHVVKNAWRHFDVPLIRADDYDEQVANTPDYGLTLTATKPIRSDRLRRLVEKENE